MTDVAQHLPPGFNFSGRYLVVRCIGAGGMGTVYECVHSETHGRCALKVMAPRLVNRDDSRKRFLLEARVTAKIASDHIVRVFDAGVDEGTGMPFIVMELLEGEDLDALLGRVGRLVPTAVLTLLRQAALALDRTHAAGVVHRDLKPHNLFVSRRDDGSPSVKILDFGIAKLIDDTGGSQKTRSAGTPVYMPPEQVRGEGDIGAAADAYALAHIAYTMLVGRPYWETEAVELGLGPFIERVFAGPSEPPSARAARAGVTLPSAFDAWFVRAASPSKHARILPVSEEVDALAQVFGVSLANMPSASFPPAPSVRVPPSAPENAQPGTLAAEPVSPATALPFSSERGTAGVTPPAATTAAVVSAGERPADRAGVRPQWLFAGALVVLASVAAGSFLTFQLVSSERKEQRASPDDEEDDDRRSKKRRERTEREPPPCAWERCENVKIDKKKPVEALDHLAAATKLARAMERDAELVMMSVGETVEGKVLPDASFAVVYIFRYPKPAGKPDEWSGLQVILNYEQMLGRRESHVGMEAVLPPRCSTQQALAAAFASGLSPKERTSAVFALYPGASSPHWMLSQSGDPPKIHYVHGVTCQTFSPFRDRP